MRYINKYERYDDYQTKYQKLLNEFRSEENRRNRKNVNILSNVKIIQNIKKDFQDNHNKQGIEILRKVYGIEGYHYDCWYYPPALEWELGWKVEILSISDTKKFVEKVIGNMKNPDSDKDYWGITWDWEISEEQNRDRIITALTFIMSLRDGKSILYRDKNLNILPFDEWEVYKWSKVRNRETFDNYISIGELENPEDYKRYSIVKLNETKNEINILGFIKPPSEDDCVSDDVFEKYALTDEGRYELLRERCSFIYDVKKYMEDYTEFGSDYRAYRQVLGTLYGFGFDKWIKLECTITDWVTSLSVEKNKDGIPKFKSFLKELPFTYHNCDGNKESFHNMLVDKTNNRFLKYILNDYFKNNKDLYERDDYIEYVTSLLLAIATFNYGGCRVEYRDENGNIAKEFKYFRNSGWFAIHRKNLWDDGINGCFKYIGFNIIRRFEIGDKEVSLIQFINLGNTTKEEIVKYYKEHPENIEFEKNLSLYNDDVYNDICNELEELEEKINKIIIPRRRKKYYE